MRKEISIQIGKEVITAELLTDLAPRTCRAIEAALPIKGFLNHAKLVDREVLFQVPIFVDGRENNKRSEKGDLGFSNGRQTICIFYDDTVPLGPCATFGRITGNLEGLQREAAECWEKPGKPISITAKER